MSLTVTLTLDDQTAAYLQRIAADQGRTPEEVAAWIVTEDLRREQVIDADLLAHLDAAVADASTLPPHAETVAGDAPSREHAGA
jgi:hypothetical protein